MSRKEILRIILKYPFDILSLIWFGVSMLFGYLWCKIVGHKFIDSHISKERDGCIEVYEICERCLKEKHTTIYDCDDYSPGDLINERVVEEKPKFQVIDSAPKRFITDRCIHEYEPTPYQKYRDIRVLKCKICGNIKKENTRIKKPKQR